MSITLLACEMSAIVKNPPEMQETPVRFLGQEDPLVEEMATHSSNLAWEIPWTEEPGRLQSMEFSNQNTGAYSLSLLQGIFLTQESNWGFLNCR